MDPSRLCVIILFSVNFVYSAPIDDKPWCQFPPKALIDSNGAYKEPCSRKDTLPGLKKICDRLDIESDCYFVNESESKFPTSDLINNIYDEKIDGSHDTRVNLLCQYLSEIQLMTVEDNCPQICNDTFYVCDLYVAMDKVLRQYFIQEIGIDGSNYQRLEVFIHSGKYRSLFPYPLERSLHASSQLQLCSNETTDNATAAACKLVGALAVKFVQAGKPNTISPIHFLKNSIWDPCQAMTNFTDFQLPGIEVLKDNKTCNATCSGNNVNICKTLLLGFQAFNEKSVEASKIGVTNTGTKLDDPTAIGTLTDNKNIAYNDDSTAVTNGGDTGENTVIIESDNKTTSSVDGSNNEGNIGEPIVEVESGQSGTNTRPGNLPVSDPGNTEATRQGITDTGEEKVNEGGSSNAAGENLNENSLNENEEVIEKGSKATNTEPVTKAPTEKTGEKDLGSNNGDNTVNKTNLEPSNTHTEITDDITAGDNDHTEGDNKLTNTDDDNDDGTNKNDDGTNNDDDGNDDSANNNDDGANNNDDLNTNSENESAENSNQEIMSAVISSSPTSLTTSEENIIDHDDDNAINDVNFGNDDDTPSKPEKTVDIQDKDTKNSDDSNKYQQSEVSSDDYDDDEEGSGGHFMAYFLVFMVVCVAGYIIFHNKQKIIALVIEGKVQSSSRRPSTKEYKRLKTEDVMPSLEKSAYSKNYVF